MEGCSNREDKSWKDWLKVVNSVSESNNQHSIPRMRRNASPKYTSGRTWGHRAESPGGQRANFGRSWSGRRQSSGSEYEEPPFERIVMIDATNDSPTRNPLPECPWLNSQMEKLIRKHEKEEDSEEDEGTEELGEQALQGHFEELGILFDQLLTKEEKEEAREHDFAPRKHFLYYLRKLLNENLKKVNNFAPRFFGPSTGKTCVFCDREEHFSEACSKYILLIERQNRLRTKNLCLQCGHRHRCEDYCQGNPCRLCYGSAGKPHVKALCPGVTEYVRLRVLLKELENY